MRKLVRDLEYARIWVFQASGFDQPWWNKERAKRELEATITKIEQVQAVLKAMDIPAPVLIEDDVARGYPICEP